MINLLINL